MPTLNFILPHWMYWGGLLLFPLAAMFLVSRQQKRGTPREPILFDAYLFWLTAGFAGVHRIYLKSWWGLAYIPVFLGVVYCNSQVREVHDDVSRTFAALEQVQTEVNRSKLADPAAATAEQRKRSEKAQADHAVLLKEYQEAKEVSDNWTDRSRWLGILIALGLLVDAFLMPGIVCRMHASGQAGVAVAATAPTMPPPPDVPAIGTAQDPTMHLHTRFTDAIEWVNVKAGEYVAYWGVIAVFVYYYEVVARFVFNSPTNWVHESMFLMFGMQYMISGAYAYKEDQHVRVDVVYTHVKPRSCDPRRTPERRPRYAGRLPAWKESP